MLKVIVTGSAGHFGSFFSNRMLQNNVKVIGIDNLLYGGDSMLSFISHPNFEFKNLDICNGLDAFDGRADYVYGRQIGRDATKYSERMHFKKYFPEL